MFEYRGPLNLEKSLKAYFSSLSLQLDDLLAWLVWFAAVVL